jgi:hypothetical protein
MGRRKTVGGQEDLIEEVALELKQQPAALRGGEGARQVPQ